MTFQVFSHAAAAFAAGLAVYWAMRLKRLRPLESALEAKTRFASNTLSELKDISQRLAERTRAIHTVYEVTSTISANPTQLQDCLGAIASLVAKTLKADVCAFLLLEESSNELVTQAGSYGVAEDEGLLYRISMDNADSSSVRVFKSKVPFLTGDAQNDPRVISQYARLWKCHSLLVAPLHVEGRSIGVMRVGSFSKDAFNEDHLNMVTLIAEEAAVVVETAMLYRELRETAEQLSRLDRIKDDFVSTVSHEFKTPLTSIKGFLTVLLNGEAGPLTEVQKKFLSIVMNASNRLAMLVSDLLDLSRLKGGLHMEFSSTSIQDLIRGSIEHYQVLSQDKGIELKGEVPSGLPPVLADSHWMTQVLDNLVSNALKFTPSGGRVSISAQDKGDCVMVCVRDNGIGINPEDRPHVFEKFYRAKNRGEINPPGTGLGLALAKSIMDKHKSGIWVESAVGKGSQFYFLLPVAKNEESESKQGVSDQRSAVS